MEIEPEVEGENRDSATSSGKLEVATWLQPVPVLVPVPVPVPVPASRDESTSSRSSQWSKSQK